MTYRELCREGVTALTGRFPDTADFIARELLLGVSGLSRADYPLTQNDRCPPPVEGQYRKGILELLNGRPLQYLLGEWDFYGLTFSVGEGVLIPRPETELLVDSVLDYQRLHPGKPLRVLDLCAGSGCIGLTIAHECPEATVIAVEKSPEAFSYLKKNAAALSMGERYLPVPGDILEEPAEQLRSLGPFDVLVSNPPYIRTGELPSLPREVQREPSMALDGGEDGLLFYRAIRMFWLSLLKPGALVALESGEDQGDDLLTLFQDSLDRPAVYRDYAGLPRGLTGKMPSD